jgi:hypothetical protein
MFHPPARMMSGPLFAVIVCRKFAIEAAMFWHLQPTRVHDPAAQCPGCEIVSLEK